jgi:multidrug transporter EmrE-like cation transporter
MLKLILLFSTIFILEMIALYSVKRSSIGDGKLFLFASMACYATIPIFLLLIIKKIPMALTNSIWNIVSTMYGLLIGIMIFGEIVSVQQWVGLGLGVIGFGMMTSWVATPKG